MAQSIHARELLPYNLQYGTSKELNVGMKQVWKVPVQNQKYYPTNQILFQPEYGINNQYFLDTNEIYLDFQFSVTDTVSSGYNYACLDYTTDALFEKFILKLGNDNVEILDKYNRFCMYCNDYTQMSTPYIVSSSSTCSTIYQTTSDANTAAGTTVWLNSTNINSGVNSTRSLTPTVTTTSCLGRPTDIFFGKDPTKIRTGLGMLVNTTQYNLAWHLKSFIIGKWSENLFPLFASPAIEIQLTLDNVNNSLVVPCTTVNSVTTNNLTTSLSYEMNGLRFHYTLISMDAKVRGLIGSAYISDSLFDIMNSTISYLTNTQTINVGTTNVQIQVQFPITSLKQLVCFFLRASDYGSLYNYYLTNNVGGFYQLQCTVGEVRRPENVMEIKKSPYQLYRDIAFGLGEPYFTNANYPIEQPTTLVGTSTLSINTPLIYGTGINGYSSLGYKGATTTCVTNLHPTAAYTTANTNADYFTTSPSDYWNAVGDKINGSRGNFVWFINLENANMFDNHRIRGGLDVSGAKNILFDIYFETGILVSYTMLIFALYDVHFSIEGSKAEKINATKDIDIMQ